MSSEPGESAESAPVEERTAAASRPEVDLVVNAFERNYRQVFSAGFFSGLEDQNRFRFAQRVALINNVEDVADAKQRADALVASGELHGYHLVERELARALSITGIGREDLGRLPHYSDCSLVAVTLPGSPWLLYWDPDIYLERPTDWISPAIARMDADPRLVVANPLWEDSTLDSTTLEYDGDFAIGQGFSDQVYLVRRTDLGAPVYNHRCIATYRYPVSAIAYVFEARVDAWMRHEKRLRLTYLPARYRHPVHTIGSARERSRPAESLRRMRNGIVLKALAASPWKPACCRLM
jgi:hypothetical protein